MPGKSTKKWDLLAENHGTIWLLRPLTPRAEQWLKNNLEEGCQYLGPAAAVEHRFVGDIIQGAQADGLLVRAKA